MSMFISFEGGESSGKSTQAEILLRRLQQAGIKSTLVQEPGTTPLGVYLRDWLKRERDGGEGTSPRAELFLFEAARAELAAKVIKPTLDGGNSLVIADRFADSTVAYQGYGRRLDLEAVDRLNKMAMDGTAPDLTFLLDCPPEEGLKRVGTAQKGLPLEPSDSGGAKRLDQKGTRRFEEESLDFHRRVRAGYRILAEQEPDRWHVLDATRPSEEISESVWERVVQILPEDADVNSSGPQSDEPLWSTKVAPYSAEDSPQ